MKYIPLTILSFLIIITANSQCYRSVSLSGSIGFGVDKNGFTQSMEFGLWPIDFPAAGFIGVNFYNEKVNGTERGKPITYNQIQKDLYLRLVTKTYSSDQYYQLATAFISINADFGGSYRFYRKIGEVTLIGLEASYSYRQQAGVKLVTTFNF